MNVCERSCKGCWRGEGPYLWLDATYMKVHKGGRVVSVAVIIACSVSLDGRRKIIGMGIGEPEGCCCPNLSAPTELLM